MRRGLWRSSGDVDQVGGGVVLAQSPGDGSAEDLVHPAAGLGGDVVGPSPLDARLQERAVLAGDLGQRLVAQGGQDVLVQVKTDALQGGIGPAVLLLGGIPLFGRCTEGAQLGALDGFLFGLGSGLALQWIDSVGQQLAHVSSLFPRPGPRQLGIAT
ncbi:hypothetical protein D9M68_831630 [compost metagenome]